MNEVGRRRSTLADAGVLGGTYLAVTVALIAVGLLMTHVLLHGTIGHWDDHVMTWSLVHRSPGWNRLSADATFIANTLGIAVVGGLATVAVLVWRRTRWALLLLLGLSVELAAFLSVNYTVARPRPTVPHLGSTPSTYSWPSGHVAATFVLYGGIAVLVMKMTRRRAPVVFAWLVAAFLTVVVGISRVYRGEHHPTDVLAGLVLGLGALAGATHALHVRRGNSTPDAAPGADEAAPPDGGSTG